MLKSVEHDQHVRVKDGTSLRGYHGPVRTGRVRDKDTTMAFRTGVVLIMDEPAKGGYKIAGPFYPSELEEVTK